MREVTERPEGVERGISLLVGIQKKRVIAATKRLLTDQDEYIRMSRTGNPYGDGKTSIRIREIVERQGEIDKLPC